MSAAPPVCLYLRRGQILSQALRMLRRLQSLVYIQKVELLPSRPHALLLTTLLGILQSFVLMSIHPVVVIGKLDILLNKFETIVVAKIEKGVKIYKDLLGN